MVIRAVAHANIALIKYWGKSNIERNLPAVPSLSLTLEGLKTVTRVSFDDGLADDEVSLDGEATTGRPRKRVIDLLDQVRARAGSKARARVSSHNEFPTAAGLASSASGFAALAMAATRAAGLSLPTEEVSDLARQASASAARSLYGGWASLGAGASSAEAVAGPEHLDVRMLVAVTALGPKAVGSTEGMQHTARTSPYYSSWVAHAPTLFERGRAALLARDLTELGTAMEESTLAMHASMLAAAPALSYLSPVTWAVIARVRELRAAGAQCYFTMDAGPHVKVLVPASEASQVSAGLAQIPGVKQVIECRPGPAASWEEE